MSARDRRMPGVRCFEAATPGEEAQAIALALCRALDTPEQTAALVTPDRGLARRVAAHLKRWGIAIDDSAGLPLSRTTAGAFLALLADAAAERFSPVALDRWRVVSGKRVSERVDLGGRSISRKKNNDK